MTLPRKTAVCSITTMRALKIYFIAFYEKHSLGPLITMTWSVVTSLIRGQQPRISLFDQYVTIRLVKRLDSKTQPTV